MATIWYGAAPQLDLDLPDLTSLLGLSRPESMSRGACRESDASAQALHAAI